MESERLESNCGTISEIGVVRVCRGFSKRKPTVLAQGVGRGRRDGCK